MSPSKFFRDCANKQKGNGNSGGGGGGDAAEEEEVERSQKEYYLFVRKVESSTNNKRSARMESGALCAYPKGEDFEDRESGHLFFVIKRQRGNGRKGNRQRNATKNIVVKGEEAFSNCIINCQRPRAS